LAFQGEVSKASDHTATNFENYTYTKLELYMNYFPQTEKQEVASKIGSQ
jgi:hypothetical protein